MEKVSKKKKKGMENACKRSHMLDLEDTRIIAVRLWGSQDGIVFPQRERGRGQEMLEEGCPAWCMWY